MGSDLIDDLTLQEVKEILVNIEEQNRVIIGHLESLEAVLLSAQTIEEVHSDGQPDP